MDVFWKQTSLHKLKTLVVMKERSEIYLKRNFEIQKIDIQLWEPIRFKQKSSSCHRSCELSLPKEDTEVLAGLWGLTATSPNPRLRLYDPSILEKAKETTNMNRSSTRIWKWYESLKTNDKGLLLLGNLDLNSADLRRHLTVFLWALAVRKPTLVNIESKILYATTFLLPPAPLLEVSTLLYLSSVKRSKVNWDKTSPETKPHYSSRRRKQDVSKATKEKRRNTKPFKISKRLIKRQQWISTLGK